MTPAAMRRRGGRDGLVRGVGTRVVVCDCLQKIRPGGSHDPAGTSASPNYGAVVQRPSSRQSV